MHPIHPAPLSIDHVVIAVPALDAAIADYRALGFTVLPGGRHPGRSSHNALVVLADGSYLELIAWQSPAPEERWYTTLQADGAGLVDFALLPENTAQQLAAARARGLDSMGGPFDGGRVRPDGVELRWQTARHSSPDLPFLCGDLSPRGLRVSELAADRQHANGASGIAGLELVVHSLDRTLARYQALLGPDCAIEREAEADGLQRARLTLGSGQQLWLLSPTTALGEDHASTAALRMRLTRRGEGPCRLLLRHPGQGPRLAPALSQGVALEWLGPDGGPQA